MRWIELSAPSQKKLKKLVHMDLRNLKIYLIILINYFISKDNYVRSIRDI